MDGEMTARDFFSLSVCCCFSFQIFLTYTNHPKVLVIRECYSMFITKNILFNTG